MLSRRLMAFFIDAIIIAVPVMAAAIVIFLFGIVTLGLGWMLFGCCRRLRSSGRSPITA